MAVNYLFINLIYDSPLYWTPLIGDPGAGCDLGRGRCGHRRGKAPDGRGEDVAQLPTRLRGHLPCLVTYLTRLNSIIENKDIA